MRLFDEDAVAGTHLLDGALLSLTEPDALDDEDRLAERMRVPAVRAPGRSGEQGLGPARSRSCGDGVDVDVPGEPAGRALEESKLLRVISSRRLPQADVTPGDSCALYQLSRGEAGIAGPAHAAREAARRAAISVDADLG